MLPSSTGSSKSSGRKWRSIRLFGRTAKTPAKSRCFCHRDWWWAACTCGGEWVSLLEREFKSRLLHFIPTTIAGSHPYDFRSSRLPRIQRLHSPKNIWIKWGPGQSWDFGTTQYHLREKLCIPDERSRAPFAANGKRQLLYAAAAWPQPPGSEIVNGVHRAAPAGCNHLY